MINVFSENNFEKLLNKKVKVTFFNGKIKIGILKRANYYELGDKNHFVVDGQPFYAEYVNSIEKVKEND